MHTFTDTAGRDWTLAINITAVRRVRDLAAVDLLDAGNVLERLAGDPVLLADVLYALVKPQADERQVTDEQFGEALGGDVIEKAAEALLEELVDFFPSPKRRILKTALGKLKEYQARVIQSADREISSGKLDAAIDQAMASILGGSSGSSPASPRSPPDPGP